ncbi:MAG: hypothetical protein NT001_03325 [Candidatus Woesearchaeota archaeon]|nr:hypothetical protein [Candidatus Woesearchaeota archaeon]
MAPYDFDVQKHPSRMRKGDNTWLYVIIGFIVLILVIILLKY